ncbi:MAG: HAMP domain-containing histidine kinase [Muribaculaceae bacterium]|nr:HAMP domain-containing histidine kinase [Muribaculaceae bacterium]
MASKRRISYRLQLFLPMVFTLWVMIIAFAVWQYKNIRENQMTQLRSQLALVNARIIDQYENDLDPTVFLDFITRYFRDSPDYKALRVTIYKDGQRLKSYGEPISLSRDQFTKARGVKQGLSFEREVNAREDDSETFNERDDTNYYGADVSADGRLIVYTSVPVSPPKSDNFFAANGFLIALFIVAMSLTVFSYFTSRYFGRNIRTLHEFAKGMAEGKPAGDYVFSHDELGDISRQIVELYDQRLEASKRTAEEHAVAMHAIEERARSKRQLTNNINHELRTPIGVIKGYLDTILENPDMDADSRTHFLRKAQDHVNRLAQLISDVSAITRLEDGGDLINTEDLNFHDLAFAVGSDLQESGALKQLKFKLDVPLDCMVEGNFNLLSGVITNLAKNAANYSKGTECELKMTKDDGKMYHFVFRDNGVGVAPEHLPHLFERFYRVDSGRARKAGGTGLGLPIVYNTIVVHGGEISVLNREDGSTGLEFRFSLPKFKENK